MYARVEFKLSRTKDWLEGKVPLEGLQVWFMDGSRMDTGPEAGVYKHISESLGSSVFQVEVYTIAVCVSDWEWKQIEQIQT